MIDPTGKEIALAAGMNPIDVATTLTLLATQYQKQTQRDIITAAAKSPIHNTVGVTHAGVPCNQAGNACGGEGGANRVFAPKGDIKDTSKITDKVTVDLKASEQTNTPPDQTMKHELEHMAQINTDPQGAISSNQAHQNDPNPGQTNPVEILAQTAENSPNDPDSMTFDQALSDVLILVSTPGSPQDYVPITNDIPGPTDTDQDQQ